VGDLFAGIGESPITAERTLTAKPAGPPEAARRPPEPRRSGITWVKDNTYVVVQSFRGDAREDAVRAKDYLDRHGIKTEIFGGVDRGFRLITVRGFNRDDKTQREAADQFLQRIRSVGKAYFDAGGRYRLEGYFAKMTSDTW
jgi:hypothetical protein